ncbi:MAG: DUF4293 domain-containing protein [Bacteroidales bacterium]|nr:DUF4293 domain-containing protein [Bacteroidales bacterium]
MFQRIQTIYLSISLIAIAVLFFIPVIAFSNDAGGVWGLFASGIRESDSGKIVLETIPLIGYLALIEVLTLISMFSYRKLDNQLKITLLVILLQVLTYGVIAAYTLRGKNILAAHPVFIIATLIPMVSALFGWLAYRGIKKDIDLLKSLDRLR